MEKWPNFFIVGAPKAGTTSLYEYLKDIPGIYMSTLKEPNYFSSKTISKKMHKRTIRDKKKYLKLFDKVKDEKIVGEASPTYLFDPDAPTLIHDISPNALTLISLRDPVERIFSQYLMGIRLGNYKKTFHDQIHAELADEIEYTQPSLRLKERLFFGNVKRYLDVFGQKQVKIIIFEEWVKKIQETLQEILDFLNVNFTITEFDKEAHNPFVMSRGKIASQLLRNWKAKEFAKKTLPLSSRLFIRNKFLYKKEVKPQMENEDRELLIRFYRNDVKKLQTLLGRNMPWQNF